ncbi:MAG TPA: MBL fold metallo-hydrolase [Verrucomicrobiae bacterium]|nr:MBL fold metallo-hydrolase [Verrucomicrobiae bacterium]
MNDSSSAGFDHAGIEEDRELQSSLTKKGAVMKSESAFTMGNTNHTLCSLILILFLIIIAAAPKSMAQTTIGPMPITPAPLPLTSNGPPIDPQKGYLVQELGDGLFFLTDGGYQCMFLTTGKGVILVDAPPDIGTNIIKAIREVTSEPVKYVVYSHSHADHIGSAGLFPNATFIAQKEAAELIVRDNDPNRPVPQIIFDREFTLRLGHQVLQLKYFGPNHTHGNVFIYAPKQKVLMLVDVYFPGWSMVESFSFTGVTDLPGWVAAQDIALTYDFKYFVGGHLNRLGTREDMEVQREYVTDLRRNAVNALSTITLESIARVTGVQNSWFLFSSYLSALAQSCTDATLAKWKDRLGGADIFTWSHCNQIMQSLRANDGFAIDRPPVPVP